MKAVQVGEIHLKKVCCIKTTSGKLYYFTKK